MGVVDCVVDCADDIVRLVEDARDTDRRAVEEEEGGIKCCSLGPCVGPPKEKGEVELLVAATDATSGSTGSSAPAPARLFLACPSPSSGRRPGGRG